MDECNEGDCVQDLSKVTASASVPIETGVPGKEREVSMFMPPDRSSIKDGLISCVLRESRDSSSVVCGGEVRGDVEGSDFSQPSSDVSWHGGWDRTSTEDVGDANIMGEIGMGSSNSRDCGGPGVAMVPPGTMMRGRSGRENEPPFPREVGGYKMGESAGSCAMT